MYIISRLPAFSNGVKYEAHRIHENLTSVLHFETHLLSTKNCILWIEGPKQTPPLML